MKTRLVLLLLLATFLPLGAETYSFSGDRSFSVMREGEEVTSIEGDVSIISESKEIYADRVSISGVDDPEFSGDGAVQVKDLEKDLDLKAQEFSYSSAEGILRAKGDVRMEDRANDLFIRCQLLSVEEEKDRVVMEIGIRLFKDDIICRSQYALYIREENLLELTGFPVVYKGSDQYRADRITVNLETDEIIMTGRIEGSLQTEAEESEEADPDVPPEEGSEPPEEGDPAEPAPGDEPPENESPGEGNE
ncbi:MAG: LptA/OstA family protein [Spirochaetales bacterium]|nr:LptA/OstA family protein [Spirochaetales bacterium]